MQAGADPNAAGRDGMTPRVWAARARRAAGVRALLARGVNPNDPGPPGLDPLSVAAGADDPEVLGVLLDAKGNPNARNSVGDRLLYTDVMNGPARNVHLLLQCGADPNALSNAHITPALLAARTDAWDVVALRLERGADPSVPAHGGGTIANAREDNATGRVSGDPAQAGNRERVRQLLVARGVHFPAERPEAVRERVFGPDTPIDRRIAREQTVRDSLGRDSAAGRRVP